MKKLNRLHHLLAVLFIGAIFFACSKSTPAMNSSNPNAVSIKNMAFSPSTLSVASGTTVTWTNNDGIAHTVTADDGSFNSGNVAPGNSFTHTFSSPGTVSYHCSIHPMMTGAVVVSPM
jgi:plastocyanin